MVKLLSHLHSYTKPMIVKSRNLVIAKLFFVMRNKRNILDVKTKSIKEMPGGKCKSKRERYDV